MVREKDETGILVVEDGAIFRRELKKILTEKNYKVFAVSEKKPIEDAIDILKNKKVSTIILDLSMLKDDSTNRDGLKILTYMKEHDIFVPIICVSGYVKVSEALEFVGSGDFYYVFHKGEFTDNKNIFLSKVADSIIYKHRIEKNRYEGIFRKYKKSKITSE